MMTNKYCQALAALRSKPAHELKEVGDQWRTPDLLFWGINALFGPLVLDLFADADMLDESQQNKLKANINQLWLERTATSEIITAASELVRNMRGEAA